MGVYFLDTSALVKRYFDEQGSIWVRTCCQPEAGHTIVISEAAFVETVATFCRKARETHLNVRISEADRDLVIGRFRQDAQQQYSVVQVTHDIYTRAGDLCRFHRLRAYDAVQLACALAIGTGLSVLHIVPTFVSADKALLDIASAEGLNIENPSISLLF